MNQVFRATLLFRRQLMGYEDGDLVVKEEVGPFRIDTGFNVRTAGGRTRQCAWFACGLEPSQLSTIVALADQFINYEATSSEDEALSSDGSW